MALFITMMMILRDNSGVSKSCTTSVVLYLRKLLINIAIEDVEDDRYVWIVVELKKILTPTTKPMPKLLLIQFAIIDCQYRLSVVVDSSTRISSLSIGGQDKIVKCLNTIPVIPL